MTMNNLSSIEKIETRSISAENFTGEKGKGGMATEGTGANCARDLGIGWKISPSIILNAGSTFELANIEGPGMIKHIWITEAGENRNLILRIYWEDSDIPSVETPLGDFFACADINNFQPLSSLAVCVNPKRAFNCYWEMPFRKRCRITLENISSKNISVYYQVDYELKEIPENCGYFHAQFRRLNPLPYGEVYTILDDVKGNGKYIGTYMFWGLNNNGWWGEGEIKFYLDGDKEFSTICGTGTEDYFCGAWCFDVNGEYKSFCTPYSGVANIIRPNGYYQANHRFSLYRWHITDPVYFKNDIRVTMQALGWRSEGRYLPLQDDISSVAFWYQDGINQTPAKLPDKDYLEII